MLSFLFGKKRTMRRKKHSSKKNTKPSSKVIKLARKYQIKVTMKRGSKRVYKSSRVLKKQINRAMRVSKSLFGKKNAKPSSKIVKLAKRYSIKLTMKRGSKRVYKSSSVLKKQIITAMRKMSKMSKKNKRNNRFGMPGSFMNTTPDFGYSNGVGQVAGLPGQSTEFVTLKNNQDRPHQVSYDKKNISLRLDNMDLPIKGTYKDFFGQKVPSTVGPHWNFLAQPGGKPMVAVGTPFYAYRN